MVFVQIFSNVVAVEQFPIHKVVIFFSLIFIIMGMRLKFFSKSYLKHWNTPMQVPHRSELQNMKIRKTLDGRGDFLVRDIKNRLHFFSTVFSWLQHIFWGKIMVQPNPFKIDVSLKWTGFTF